MSDRAEAFTPRMRRVCNEVETELGDLLECRREAMDRAGFSVAEQTSVMLSALATGFGAVLLGLVRRGGRHEFVRELSQRLHVTLLKHAAHKSVSESEES